MQTHTSTEPTQSKRPAIERATYSLAEFAALLGIGYTSAHERAQDGTLPVMPLRVGRRYLFPKATVHRMLGVGNQGNHETA